MALFRRLVLIPISVQAFSQGPAPTDGCAEQCEPSTAGVSLLQLNGMLKAIEDALDTASTDQEGHLIHTPNGPRVAHMSHLPVQDSVPDPSARAQDSAPDPSALVAVEASSRDGSREASGALDLHADDPHADPHAVAPADPHTLPEAEPHREPPAAPHSDVPAPAGQEPQSTSAPSSEPPHLKEGYENAHPADLQKEKYAYLNGLAAFAIGPGMFFLGLLAVTTFGLFFYAYKNDPRIFG
jgi:hypothetical protein